MGCGDFLAGLWRGGMYHINCCALVVPAWVVLGSCWVVAWRHVPCHMMCVGGARMGCGEFLVGLWRGGMYHVI